MTREIEAREKVAVSPEGEPTRPGPVFSPAVDIYESEEGLTLLADMPGVDRENLSIDLKDSVLTIRGIVKSPPEAGRKMIHREYREGDYVRRFSLPEVIDQDKISAALKDGVLTLALPKVEPAKPKRIEVTAG